MYAVEGNCIATAHSLACKYVIEYGEYVITEDNQSTLELSDPLAIKVNNPLCAPVRHEKYPLSENALQEYIPMMCKAGNENGHAYQYGDRMRAYPYMISSGYVDTYYEEEIDQIVKIVNMLNSESNTRRAIAHTWIVETDLGHKTPPCMQTVQFVIRNNKLNVVVYFRSNDMCMAYGANAFGLAHLQKYVAEQVGCDTGYLQTVSMCAHIYETDLKEAKAIAYG